MLLVYVAKVYLPLRSGILNLKIFMNLRGGFFPQKKSEKYNHSLILNFRFEYFEEKKNYLKEINTIILINMNGKRKETSLHAAGM